tara:strand:- start:122 stop:268 length:147 start_codon:yes stop_codon:yes gene_type:complete
MIFDKGTPKTKETNMNLTENKYSLFLNRVKACEKNKFDNALDASLLSM